MGGRAERALAEAVRRAGADDLGSPHVLTVIDRWCEDLDSHFLSESGRDSLERALVRNLVLRLRIHALLAAHPEITHVPIPPVILITGLPRSGTTLLHQLMSCHPHSRPLLRWELVSPLPPPEAASYRTDPRIARVQSSIDPMRGTMLERTHWVNADEPEECPSGFYDASGLMGRGVVGIMRSWTDHVLGMDHRATFFEYRRLIQILLWHNPPDERAVLVLKSPAAADHLAAFAEVFPESSFVVTHRDPFRTVISAATLLSSVGQQFAAADVDVLADDGRTERHVLRMQAAAVTALADFVDHQEHRVTHVAYPALMADPVGVAVSALEAGNVGAAQQAEPGATTFLARQASGHRATPPSAYDDRGYRADDIHDDPAIARYMERFGVEREMTRMARPAT